jgi:hypothetical protein
MVAGNDIARPLAATVGAAPIGKHADYVKTGGSTVMGNSGLIYPDQVSGGPRLERVFLHEGSNIVRGTLRGVWCPLHARPLGIGDTFDTAGSPTRSFEAVNVFANGQAFLETTSTWDQ